MAQQQQEEQPQSQNPNQPWTHVVFETSAGTFCIELYYQHAPRTCYNVAALAHAGYYDTTIFHRIIRDFMIQGGDPTGTGRGGESIFGKYQLEDEILPTLKHTGAGVVAMANAGKPNTAGSQFYITLKPTPWLDGKHAIFGRISHGMAVIQRLGMVATNDQDEPLQRVTIHRATPYRGVPPASVLTQRQPSSSLSSLLSSTTTITNQPRIANY